MNQIPWCIPGFLGAASDWDILLCEHRAVDLFKDFVPASLTEWAQEFTKLVASVEPPAPLIGYSLGGRLALHALVERPELFSKAVIISSHLGFDEEIEKALRIQQDQHWANRFLRDSWQNVTADWDNQLLFGGRDKPLVRHEHDYNRKALAYALTHWSLGKQDLPLEKFAALTMPILWITGEEDLRFQVQAERAKELLPHIETWVCPQAGHRVLWESEQACLAKITEFLQS